MCNSSPVSILDAMAYACDFTITRAAMNLSSTNRQLTKQNASKDTYVVAGVGRVAVVKPTGARVHSVLPIGGYTNNCIIIPTLKYDAL